jgi:anti-anti-sigma factor
LLRTRKPDRFPSDTAALEALKHPLTFGACLVGIGAADVMVGGADYPTADTIRAALWAVGTAPGITTVSGAFYMMKDDRVLTFADCAVVPEPTATQLADIALATARDRRGIVGDEPVVAFLSYSTKGSAAGPRVERVQAAIADLRRRAPTGFVFDGELQGDAALVLDVATHLRPVARRHRRRYCEHGGDRSLADTRGGPMSFSVKKDKSGVVVVGVDGQLIVGNRQELKQKVLDALEAGGRKFVVDFAKTGYIDSSGLGVLVSLSKKIREQGGELRLAGLNEDLQTLFELTKLDTLFAITKTAEEALAAF